MEPEAMAVIAILFVFLIVIVYMWLIDTWRWKK